MRRQIALIALIALIEKCRAVETLTVALACALAPTQGKTNGGTPYLNIRTDSRRPAPITARQDGLSGRSMMSAKRSASNSNSKYAERVRKIPG